MTSPRCGGSRATVVDGLPSEYRGYEFTGRRLGPVSRASIEAPQRDVAGSPSRRCSQPGVDKRARSIENSLQRRQVSPSLEEGSPHRSNSWRVLSGITFPDTEWPSPHASPHRLRSREASPIPSADNRPAGSPTEFWQRSNGVLEPDAAPSAAANAVSTDEWVGRSRGPSPFQMRSPSRRARPASPARPLSPTTPTSPTALADRAAARAHAKPKAHDRIQSAASPRPVKHGTNVFTISRTSSLSTAALTSQSGVFTAASPCGSPRSSPLSSPSVASRWVSAPLSLPDAAGSSPDGKEAKGDRKPGFRPCAEAPTSVTAISSPTSHSAASSTVKGGQSSPHWSPRRPRAPLKSTQPESTTLLNLRRSGWS